MMKSIFLCTGWVISEPLQDATTYWGSIENWAGVKLKINQVSALWASVVINFAAQITDSGKMIAWFLFFIATIEIGTLEFSSGSLNNKLSTSLSHITMLWAYYYFCFRNFIRFYLLLCFVQHFFNHMDGNKVSLMYINIQVLVCRWYICYFLKRAKTNIHIFESLNILNIAYYAQFL